MLHQITIPLVLFLLFTLAQSQTNECIDDQKPPRAFKSLVDYQGNKITFDPRLKGFEGNEVTFLNGEINPIPKNSFVTKDSEHIRKLILTNHQIQLIEDGAFLSLNCVSTLNLRRNKIETIAKNIFQGLHHLHELDLSENKIVEIPERVFSFTFILKILDISKNSLKVLHSDSFYKLTKLEHLDISYNYLHKINADTFRYFDQLISLHLGSNQFDYLEFDEWRNLSSLKTLNLSNNELTSIDFSNNFSFSGLIELYIDDNYLSQFNVKGFRKHLPTLQIIDISENLWLCADLIDILKTFNDSRISYKGTETTDPNFSGIACNRSIEEYQYKKWTEPVLTTTTAKPISEKPTMQETELSSVSALQILDSIKSLQIIVICIFVVIALFIFIDFSIKCRCVRNFRGRHNSPILDNSDVEDISLLRGRF